MVKCLDRNIAVVYREARPIHPWLIAGLTLEAVRHLCIETPTDHLRTTMLLVVLVALVALECMLAFDPDRFRQLLHATPETIVIPSVLDIVAMIPLAWTYSLSLPNFHKRKLQKLLLVQNILTTHATLEAVPH